MAPMRRFASLAALFVVVAVLLTAPPAVPPAQSQEQTIAITNGRVFDATGASVIEDGVVVLEGARIAPVCPAVEDLNLIGAAQGIVDALYDRRDTIRGIEALVRVHFPGQIGVRRHLPSAQVDRLQAGFHLLNGLITRQRAQRVDVVFGLEEFPETRGARLRNGVLAAKRPPSL